MVKDPVISIVIASYNYEAYLGASLRSVLEQSYPHFEVIVVDDGSKDRSVFIAQEYAVADDRILLLQHPDKQNHGLPATLKLGLSAAKGQYVAFLEADDLWEKDCLKRRLEALNQSGAGVAFNDVEPLPMPGADTTWFDGYVPRIMKEHVIRSEKVAGSAFSLETELLMENKIPTFSCVMVRKTLLDQCSFTTPVPRWLDWWLWIQLAQRTSFCFVNEKLTLWRLHARSYNHRISPAYLAEGILFWKKVRVRYRRSLLRQGKWKTAVLLTLPFCVVPFSRFLSMVRNAGFKASVHRALKRI